MTDYFDKLLDEDPWIEERMDDHFDMSDDYADDPYNDEYENEWERDYKADQDDRFFDRWGYYPDEETEEEAESRIAAEEQDRILQDLNYQSLEGATTDLAAKIFEVLTAK